MPAHLFFLTLLVAMAVVGTIGGVNVVLRLRHAQRLRAVLEPMGFRRVKTPDADLGGRVKPHLPHVAACDVKVAEVWRRDEDAGLTLVRVDYVVGGLRRLRNVTRVAALFDDGRVEVLEPRGRVAECFATLARAADATSGAKSGDVASLPTPAAR